MDVKQIVIIALALMAALIAWQCSSGSDDYARYSSSSKKTDKKERKKRIVKRIVDFDKRRKEAMSSSGSVTGSGPSLPPCPIEFSSEEKEFFNRIEELNRNPVIRRARGLRENGLVDQAIFELLRLVEKNPDDPWIQFLANSELLACYEITKDPVRIRDTFQTMMSYSRVIMGDMSLSESQEYTSKMLQDVDKAKDAISTALGDQELQNKMVDYGVNLRDSTLQNKLIKLRNVLP